MASTALRILSRMRRDWITVGRKPTGLCGAAIVIACRLHGLDYTTIDIKRVLKTSKDTIRRRIIEFKESPVAELTL